MKASGTIPVGGLPSPWNAAKEVLAWLDRHGVSRRHAALLGLLWPSSMLLGWAFAHPDRHALASHGYALWMDGHAYWAAWHHDLYALPPRSIDAYLYSPAFAEALWPLTLLPFVVFAVVWWTAISAAFWWLLAPLPWVWRVPALVFTGFELQVGNVHAFFALMLVAGLRWPGVWAFALLTKVTPGLGLLWFVSRREWGQLGLALGTTAAVVTVSAAVDPHAWIAWVQFLVHQGQIGGTSDLLHNASLSVRFVVACALVVWGARTDRPWVLALAVALSSPLVGLQTLTILAALPRLVMAGQLVADCRANECAASVSVG